MASAVLVLLLWSLHLVVLLPAASGVAGGLTGRAVVLLLALLVLLLPVCLLPGRWALRVLCLALPFALAETFGAWRMGGWLSVGVWHSILSTSGGEAREFLGAQAVFVVAALLVLLFFLVLAFRPGGVRRAAPSLRIAGVPPVLLAFLLLFLVYREGRIVGRHSIDNVQSGIGRQLLRTVPVGTLLKLHTAYRLRGEVEARLATVLRSGENLQGVTSDSLPRRLVLFIGESARRDHWQHYGYTRSTTPRLLARPELLWWDSLLSPATLTWQSVPLMLNAATVENNSELLRQANIFAYAKRAGYRCTWISNQALDDSPLLQLQMRQADTLLLAGGDILRDGAYDLRLLQELQALPSYPRELIVLHSIGQHNRYDYRYPQAFDHFKPSLKGSTRLLDGSPEVRAQVLNSYDNATRYTDWLLDTLLTELSQDTARPVYLLYASDHGEALFDGPDALLGHGMPGAQPAQTQVPFFLWARTRAELPASIPAQRFPTSGDYVFETLLDLLRIRTPGVDTARSLLRQQVSLPPRVLDAQSDLSVGL